MVVMLWLGLWEIFFLPAPILELEIPGSLVLHSTTMPWWLLVFTSNNFRYLTPVQREWWWYFSAWACERFLSAYTIIQARTFGSLMLHCSTMPWWLLVLISDNLRYLTVVQIYWQWYCSDGSFEWFFLTALGIELVSTRFLKQHSTTAPWRLLVFTSENMRHSTLLLRH